MRARHARGARTGEEREGTRKERFFFLMRRRVVLSLTLLFSGTRTTTHTAPGSPLSFPLACQPTQSLHTAETQNSVLKKMRAALPTATRPASLAPAAAAACGPSPRPAPRAVAGES